MSKFPLVIGHRGASSLAPENTIPAFKKAAELGCDAVELDVQLTRDGHVVVFHDSFLNRTTDGSGFVEDFTLAELKKLDAGKHFSNEFKGTKIPTLEEVFQFLEPYNIKIITELKGKRKALDSKVSELIKTFKFENRVIVSTYNHDYLHNISTSYPDVTTEIDIVWTFENLLTLAKRLNTKVVCPIHYFVQQMWKASILRLKFNKIKLFTYTVNTKEEMLNMIRKGVDGIMTDKPQLLLEIKNKSRSKRGVTFSRFFKT